MKRTFVLDENVIIAASKGSLQSISLLTSIVRNCHSVVVDGELTDRYWRSLKRNKKTMIPEVRRLLGLLLHHAEKCRFPDKEAGNDLIPLGHQKDVFLVRLATSVGSEPAIVVLEDKRTCHDIKNRTKIKALSTKEALVYAKEV